MGSPTTQRFAVFRDPENPPDSWHSWSAYTRDFNTAWRGFVGFYDGVGVSRRSRKADAIKRAREAYAEATRHAAPTPPAARERDEARAGWTAALNGVPVRNADEVFARIDRCLEDKA